MVYPSAYCLSNTYSYSRARSDGSANTYFYSDARSDGSANTYSYSDARSDGSGNTYFYSDARIDSNARETLALADRPPCCGSAGGLGPCPTAQEGLLKQGMRLTSNPALDEYPAWWPDECRWHRADPPDQRLETVNTA